jgi:thiamine biosynthesis lipoprotein
MLSRMKYYFYVLVVIFSSFPVAQAADSSAVEYEVKVSKILMGTVVETTARHPDVVHCKKALFLAYQEMERVENLLSYLKSGSEIALINASAGKKAVHVSDETFEILQRAVRYADELHGLFDVTIGAISSLWGFSDPDGGHLPDPTDIKRRLPDVNYHDLVLNEQDTSVFLAYKDMQLDLGGIAKGYAIDRGSAVLKKNGIVNFILNAGGDMYVSGKKDSQTLWKVGVRDPRNGQELIARFDLKDYAVATSGDYERFFIVDGRRYHHIFDPRTGYPGDLTRSSTTFAATAEEADVLATYLFIIGSQQALVQNFTQPFLIIDGSGRQIASESFKKLPGLQF